MKTINRMPKICYLISWIMFPVIYLISNAIYGKYCFVKYGLNKYQMLADKELSTQAYNSFVGKLTQSLDKISIGGGILCLFLVIIFTVTSIVQSKQSKEISTDKDIKNGINIFLSAISLVSLLVVWLVIFVGARR